MTALGGLLAAGLAVCQDGKSHKLTQAFPPRTRMSQNPDVHRFLWIKASFGYNSRDWDPIPGVSETFAWLSMQHEYFLKSH